MSSASSNKAEREILDKYLARTGVRRSAQRYKIMDVFLSAEHHITVSELSDLIKKKYPAIGAATVYRTMKLFCEAGIAEEIVIGDGVVRYEHKYGHEHHDHLICTDCGKFIEAKDSQIELLQQKLAERHDFSPTYHRLQIFGLCKKCQKD
ncbi:transcriptional repressor [Chitinispirillales bacterium ANBcel5]|uniref:Fur family transcriptional regulator n=1 Tax=Cellulosispirillum alkaliphilum TaxID=3039283 RepID=UPI002A51A5C2|nr:transcriptional repressor [Chitinispirillales bacterium ANBcel5]